MRCWETSAGSSGERSTSPASRRGESFFLKIVFMLHLRDVMEIHREI